MALTLALVAVLTELAVGYPDRLFRRIGHPVTWIGGLIARLDRRWNHPETPERTRRRGLWLVLILLAGSGVAGLAAALLPLPAIAAMAVAGVACSSLIAQRSLHDYVSAVAAALEQGGVEAGRRAVAHIVGRDPQSLDESEIARAAIESLAENFSDGVVAPVFWLATFGLAGGLAYKAINTADSMIGYRNARYAEFGRAAARLDDWMNLPASRLSAGLVSAAALLLPGASAAAAARAVRRDARHHRSPNAGWPEAAMAGALGIGLAGPRSYGGVMSTDRMMNEGGRRALDVADIRRALRLYWLADGLLIALLAALVFAVGV